MIQKIKYTLIGLTISLLSYYIVLIYQPVEYLTGILSLLIPLQLCGMHVLLR
ncbi:hypothetical protein GS399_04860 [Pedobacter sp. HMF7647]|uniref:Uncharacterized protein n=1 Tax=Hufsiella arboris TaxID=2695275 RepID=A0A7K1Y6U7_9SPHI|nr:hypothetical protein [Hufsiella arboris]MXV50293.1 hypothetical protein [Hufsiella arboris]